MYVRACMLRDGDEMVTEIDEDWVGWGLRWSLELR